MKGDEWESPQIKTSKSTGSLPSSSGSIGALRARFESKVDAQNISRGIKNSPASIKPAEIPQVTDREAEGKSLKEQTRSQTADAPQKEGKDAPSSKKVNEEQRHVKMAEIFGIYLQMSRLSNHFCGWKQLMNVSLQVATRPREMRKTIAGIDFEKMVSIKAGG